MTVHLDASVFDNGYWVEWDGDAGDHGRIGRSPRSEHAALGPLDAMHDALAKAGFKLERAPNPAVVVVHASVDEVERVTGHRLQPSA